MSYWRRVVLFIIVATILVYYGFTLALALLAIIFCMISAFLGQEMIDKFQLRNRQVRARSKFKTFHTSELEKEEIFPEEGIATQNMITFEVVGKKLSLVEIGFFASGNFWNRIGMSGYDPFTQEELKRTEEPIEIEGEKYNYRLLFSTHVGDRFTKFGFDPVNYGKETESEIYIRQVANPQKSPCLTSEPHLVQKLEYIVRQVWRKFI